MSDEKRGYESWFECREDVERALHEGWRQHFCQLWGFVGQQYMLDRRYCAVSKLLGEEEVIGRGTLDRVRSWLKKLKGPWSNKS